MREVWSKCLRFLLKWRRIFTSFDSLSWGKTVCSTPGVLFVWCLACPLFIVDVLSISWGVWVLLWMLE